MNYEEDEFHPVPFAEFALLGAGVWAVVLVAVAVIDWWLG